MNPLTVRAAHADDVPAMTAIYNDVVAHSTAIYTTQPSTPAERSDWLNARTGAGFPVLAAERDGQLVGYASFAEFRGAWPGYLHSVEHSVYVRADGRRCGVGSALVRALFPLAAALDKHVMIGGIDATNEGSLRMHERLGFERVAHFREVGRKFGRWLDLVFVQRFLDAPGAPRAD
ncbi:MAG TPA: GNAT family N-acetyltransferase [Burkholderiaceae bacterium]|nr:GNAT family N-acetyltransferase [Burkholderiaceae bacterium]